MTSAAQRHREFFTNLPTQRLRLREPHRVGVTFFAYCKESENPSLGGLGIPEEPAENLARTSCAALNRYFEVPLFAA